MSEKPRVGQKSAGYTCVGEGVWKKDTTMTDNPTVEAITDEERVAALARTERMLLVARTGLGEATMDDGSQPPSKNALEDGFYAGYGLIAAAYIQRYEAALTTALSRVEALETTLIAAANTCDKWAEESHSGGWSTHQVDANKKLADDLRRQALKGGG